jgi:hypothetical protein
LSNSLLIIGASGSGKSSSIRMLDSTTTFVISVLDKPLPFKAYKKNYIPIKGWNDTEGNYFASDDWTRIIKCIHMVNENRPETTVLVIDDLQYVLANEFMKRSSERGFDKYSELAMHYWSIIKTAMACRDDLLSIFISHNEIDNLGKSKIKTIGKLLDEKITIEGMFTTVLHSMVMDGEYSFMTRTDGFHTCKSPLDMFDSQFIENDLLFIKNKIKEYYE